MQPKKKIQQFLPADISKLLLKNFSNLMLEFYEMQTTFLKTRYKVHGSLETSNIIINFIKNVHLAIVRQREKSLDFDISLNSFWDNLQKIEIQSQKIVSIVSTTGIPKETVRRKIQDLMKKDYVSSDSKNKGYYWNLTAKRKDGYLKISRDDVLAISKFISYTTRCLNLNLSNKIIQEELESQFSFYFYHFLQCELSWLKMWKTKIKDVDLMFITIQALIPTLKLEEKIKKDINFDNIHSIIGEAHNNYSNENAISASSISEVTGIPRATCIRKLQKLVNLGMLIQESKTKRYLVNQNTSDRTKHIAKKENIAFTIQAFSEFLSIVINALIRNQKFY
tara:strand:- start:516 stop:1526 length:1011 start_codon:yes stop_codon:yes gene_type:complete